MDNGDGVTQDGRWRELPPIHPDRLHLSRAVDGAGPDRGETSGGSSGRFGGTARSGADIAWAQALERAYDSEVEERPQPSGGSNHSLARPGKLAEIKAASSKTGLMEDRPTPNAGRPPSLFDSNIDREERSTSRTDRKQNIARENWKVLAFAAAAVVVAFAVVQRGQEQSSVVSSDPTTTVGLDALDGQGGQTGSEFASPSPSDGSALSAALSPAPSDGPGDTFAGPEPFLRYQWQDGVLKLSGFVPDEELRWRILDTARAIYGEDYVVSDVAEEQAGAAPPWMWSAPGFIFELSHFAMADAVLADGRLELSATTRDLDRGTELASMMQARSGLPVEVASLELADLKGAQWRTTWKEGRVLLAGALPTEELRAGYVEAAERWFGADNVIDSSSVDPTVQFELWMRDADRIFESFTNFDRVTIEHNDRKHFIGLGGGPSFATNEDDGIDLGMAMYWVAGHLVSDPSLVATVRGHTDSVGSADYNLYLGLRRADSVRQQLLSIGVMPDQVEVEGVGAAEPVASNDTEEGRAENRRIEILIGQREDDSWLAQSMPPPNNSPGQAVGQDVEMTG